MSQPLSSCHWRPLRKSGCRCCPFGLRTIQGPRMFIRLSPLSPAIPMGNQGDYGEAQAGRGYAFCGAGNQKYTPLWWSFNVHCIRIGAHCTSVRKVWVHFTQAIHLLLNKHAEASSSSQVRLDGGIKFFTFMVCDQNLFSFHLCCKTINASRLEPNSASLHAKGEGLEQLVFRPLPVLVYARERDKLFQSASKGDARETKGSFYDDKEKSFKLK